MDFLHLFTLGGATGVVALVLLVLHYMTEDYGKPWNYAIGLVVVLSGLLSWAWFMEVSVTWDVAVAMLVAGCVSGAPDAVIILLEHRKERQQ